MVFLSQKMRTGIDRTEGRIL